LPSVQPVPPGRRAEQLAGQLAGRRAEQLAARLPREPSPTGCRTSCRRRLRRRSTYHILHRTLRFLSVLFATSYAVAAYLYLYLLAESRFGRFRTTASANNRLYCKSSAVTPVASGCSTLNTTNVSMNTSCTSAIERTSPSNRGTVPTTGAPFT